MFPPLMQEVPAKEMFDGGGGNRTRATCPPLSSSLGHWLAGFTDGEGCFSISRRAVTPGRLKVSANAREFFVCDFRIKVRQDDADLIEQLPKLTGFGSVARQKASLNAGRNNNPSVIWICATRADTLGIVELFEQYPLRSKKDRKVWSKAVRYWNDPIRTRIGLTGRGGQRYRVEQEPLAALHAELAGLRAYGA